jgi:pimeloyl-ACP methyl ester carboxylesterase
MSTFVLVHGAWHDGSAWDRVVEHLNGLGHQAFGPTVAGHGRDVGKAVTHAESTRSIVDFVLDNGLTDIVLVGHSYGATIISKVAEAIPEHIRRLVFWCGFVLNDGESILDNVPPADRAAITLLASESTDNTVAMPFEWWRERFINDADLETARWAYDQLSPEPFQQFQEPLDLKKFYTLDTPKSYLLCTEDTALPHGEWAWHPRMSSRLGLHRLVQMPGSHEVIFTNPIGLADKIIEAGRD